MNVLQLPADLPRGERAARLAMARLVEPGHVGLAERIAAVGAEEALHSVDPASHLGERMAGRIAEVDPRRDLEIADRLGARIVVPGDEEWPQGLDDLEVPPLCLWLRGPLQLAETCERSASVVGARDASHYGTHRAREIAGGLAERGFTVISGAAYGIDGAAHRGALAVDGETVALTAGGIDRPYPRGHDDLFRQIATRGVVVSEIPPGWAPTKSRFLARNRMIATLSRGTVVVEAGLRSGSLNTARTALRHHRVVGAVPGSVESRVSAGCHELIRSGAAILVTDAAEVVEAVGPIGELAPARSVPSDPSDELAELEAAVLSILPVRGPAAASELARRCGLTASEVSAALGLLAANGLARRRDHGWTKVRARQGDASRPTTTQRPSAQQATAQQPSAQRPAPQPTAQAAESRESRQSGPRSPGLEE
jgi:DNA processing protein